MFTPSGRFQTGVRLCLSISDYHPKSWNPAWSVSTILTGLLSFMCADENTTGSITRTDEVRRNYAKQSKSFNITNNTQFVQQYPDLVEKNKKDIQAEALLEQKRAQEQEIPATATPQRLVPVNLAARPEDSAPSPNDDNSPPRGFSRSQKLICVAVIFVSWVVASKLLALNF